MRLQSQNHPLSRILTFTQQTIPYTLLPEQPTPTFSNNHLPYNNRGPANSLSINIEPPPT